MTTVHSKIPAACHTYSKGDDQFPGNAPSRIVRAEGYRVWAEDGREFVDWTMGLASVSLGHAYAPVVEAARQWLDWGSNFPRPGPLEEAVADKLIALRPGTDMIKLGKHGSDGTSAAVRLARAFTGRDHILACDCNPFYSVHDWWIGATKTNAGVPAATAALTHTFPFGNVEALDTLLDRLGKETAAIIIEPAATVPVESQSDEIVVPFLRSVAERAKAAGALLVFDENKTGFRMALPGAESRFGVTADIVCYGKAMANGFSVSAIAGPSDVLDQGGILQTERDRVFLLSATHGGETHALAAALKTLEIMESEPVIEHGWKIGHALVTGFNSAAQLAGLSEHFAMAGYGCFPSLLIQGTDDDNAVRTLFLQEMVARGVFFNFVVPAFVHDEAAITRTLEAASGSFAVCGQAIADGTVTDLLVGPTLRPVFRRHN